ncbi:MAG TPA: hypothetical protein VKA46_35945 [Gemmataceae bacterium]|nr:hypothetical protein [Gemmataceae bacterium]
MKPWNTLPAVLLACAAVVAADPPPAAAPTLVVVDSNGKEQKLKSWKFVAGTRPLGWLAPAAPAKEKDEKPADKPAKPADAGPEAIEFREDKSPPLKQGVLTLLLPQHLRALEYDSEKQTVTANIVLSEKADGDLQLTGSTGYVGINTITIEAEVDKGDAGIADVKYQAGVPKGVRAIRFPSPKPSGEDKGRPAFIALEYKKKKTSEDVFDLQPLYRLADKSERLLPTLPFKKTLKLDVSKMAHLVAVGYDGDDTECRVTTKDGEEQTYTLLKTTLIDGKVATLEGLVGKIRGGYKLFPTESWGDMHLDVQFDEKKGDEKP